MANSRKFLQPINLLNAALDPVTAIQGDIYYNSVSDKIRFYDGTDWNDIGGGEGLVFEVGQTPPPNPIEGQAWFDNVEGDFYIYDGSFWQQAIRTIAVDLDQDQSPSLAANLNANYFGINNIDHIDFDNSSTTDATEGILVWNIFDGTLDLGLGFGNSALSIGQQELSLCYNPTGSTITKGSVVYTTGVQGDRPSIAKASASSSQTSSQAFGIALEDILDGTQGFVITSGLAKNLVTSSLSVGDELWLSTTSGSITSTRPTYPNHSVFIGYCVKSHVSLGQIFVSIRDEYEIEELYGLSISSPENGEVLSYDDQTGLWTNTQPGSQIPDQTGNSGKYLTTDGSSPSWGEVDALPDQTGNDGKYLTTDGSSASWEKIDALPDQSGNEGKYLTTDGTNSSWEDIPSGLVDSGSSYPLSGLTNGKLFYNTSNGRTAIYFDSMWKELAYISDFNLEGGYPVTTNFESIIDGESPSIQILINSYNGGEV